MASAMYDRLAPGVLATTLASAPTRAMLYELPPANRSTRTAKVGWGKWLGDGVGLGPVDGVGPGDADGVPEVSPAWALGVAAGSMLAEGDCSWLALEGLGPEPVVPP